ncbi:MAG: DNA polymerase III subunit delta [Betaproteobacteria bacterium]|nr:DNA polymerase III subunit delta [Betaproteobacteria bacterium]
MKIATRQLAQHLKKGLSPLYAVHGAETLLALEAGDAIRAAARREGCAEREVFTAEPGADWSTLGASAANLSLFASRKLIEIRIPSGKPGAEGGKALEALCARLPEDAIVLVMLPELEWQQLKTAWFGAIEDAGTVVEARAISREELPQWLAERLARQQQRAGVETLEWMADRVEGNLLAAKQEVEKLALLLPAGEISLDAIREAVTDVSRFERDGLLDAIHEAEPGRIARAVDSLEAEAEPLPLLLWTLTEELRLMMQVSGGERPRRFLDPDRLQRVQRTARKHDAASFDRQLLRAHRIDRMIKGVETGDAWEEILELSLALAGKPALRPAA